MDVAVLAAFQRRFNTNAVTLARVLYKLYFGLPVKFTFIGDSVLEGTTVTSGGGVLGTDDAVSLIRSTLQTRFPNAVVTTSNRAQSGATVLYEIRNKWAAALADNADVYVFSGWKNDLAALTVGFPGSLQGQTADSSAAMVESKIAELRQVKPDACIVLMSDNPYSVASTAANGYSVKYNAAMQRIAYAHGCEYVDGHGAFTALNAWDYLLSDGVHPNKGGHALLAAEFLKHFPASWTPKAASDQGASFGRPGGVVNRLYRPWAYSRLGLQSLTALVGTAYSPKLSRVGTWSGSGPQTSSTAGDFMIATFNGTEAFLDLVLGAGQGTVDILVDGQPNITNLSLANAAFTNGKYLQVYASTPGWHYVLIKVISGSVTFNGIIFNQGRSQFLNWDSPSVVNVGMGTNGTGVASSPANGTYIPTAAAATQTVTFVGTGIGFHFWRINGLGAGTYTTNVTIDGVSLGALFPANGPNDYQYVRRTLVSGLAYGKHTLVITWAAAGLNVTGFDVFDESPELRPAQLQGWAGAGEVVRFGQAFPNGAPIMSAKDPSAGLTFSAVTASGFTMGATAGWWIASAPDDSAGNRLLY